jgi:hypothetical protein
VLHPIDCIRDGVSIVMGRRLQISSLDEFSDHVTDDRLEGGPSDVASWAKSYLRLLKIMHGKLNDEASPTALP